MSEHEFTNYVANCFLVVGHNGRACGMYGGHPVCHTGSVGNSTPESEHHAKRIAAALTFLAPLSTESIEAWLSDGKTYNSNLGEVSAAETAALVENARLRRQVELFEKSIRQVLAAPTAGSVSNVLYAALAYDGSESKSTEPTATA